jgi:propionyl-CoA carboxylase alpha chain
LGSTVQIEDGPKIRVEGSWTPGKQLANMLVDDTRLTMKVGKLTGGFRIRNRGADLKVTIRSELQSDLAQYMIEKDLPDTSKILMCPMPGLIVKIDVRVGEQIQEGQALCTVEAMKMENILRAERQTRVKKINVKAGDSLAVDETIMEFE